MSHRILALDLQLSVDSDVERDIILTGATFKTILIPTSTESYFNECAPYRANKRTKERA